MPSAVEHSERPTEKYPEDSTSSEDEADSPKQPRTKKVHPIL